MSTKQPYTLCLDPALVAEIDAGCKNRRSRSDQVARLLREALDRRRASRVGHPPRKPGVLTVFPALPEG